MPEFTLKSTHKAVKVYYQRLADYSRLLFDNETNLRGAMQALLESCSSKMDVTFVPECEVPRKGKSSIYPDGAIVNAFGFRLGYWEAKDSADDLGREIKKKFADGYPQDNILFTTPEHAVLFQEGYRIFDKSIRQPEQLIEVLRLFFTYREPAIDEWERAVREFSSRIPQIEENALRLIEQERKRNANFRAQFEVFHEVCKESIDPGLGTAAVEGMLVQHLLTERIFRKIFDNPEFTRRNVIAAEIEKVIDSMTSRHFSRDKFLSELDPLYGAIEAAAAHTHSYAEKQEFLNGIYEKFFQGLSRRQADTHGIVYTPQPIVEFMVRSVQEVLQREFSKSLSDPGVHVLDPFTGTGNFLVRIMQHIEKTRLPAKYATELHANEIMLLPYYIASMNIEHEYYDRAGEYRPFEGLCLVDTFELAETKQSKLAFQNAANTERVRRQKAAPITVVLGNPPYNMGQANESDQNQNRKYPALDRRIAETYTADSKATLRNKLSDPYVKAFRWASDRIGDHGIVAFVSNNKFLDGIAFDGMRMHLCREFDQVLHLNLKGNANTSGTRRQREGGNIFSDQIKVGIGITILVRNPNCSWRGLKLFSVDDHLKAKEKTNFLVKTESMAGVPLVSVTPDARHTWLTEGQREDWSGFLPLGDKQAKGEEAVKAIFRWFSLGVASNRDSYAFNFRREPLIEGVETAISVYQDTLARYTARHPRPEPDEFIDANDKRIKWTHLSKVYLKATKQTAFDDSMVRTALYRPYTKMAYYFDSFWNERRYQMPRIFPLAKTKNTCVVANQNPQSAGFYALATDVIADLHLTGDTQCFPLFTYDEDGSHRQENITDWALERFRDHYNDPRISRLELFHYVYAVLHHPEYRARYAADLKRDLPRIPFLADFRASADAGEKLMEWHLGYEKQPEYPLRRIEAPYRTLDWRVEKMRLSRDRTDLRYNEFLTLRGIPPAAYEYRLGNRSALEWLMEEYRVSTDTRSGIVNDPNREDDPEAIVRLIGQVITVSVKTAELVRSFPEWKIALNSAEKNN